MFFFITVGIIAIAFAVNFFGKSAIKKRVEEDVDNPDATVDPEGNWSTYSGSAPKYGDDLRYTAGGTGTDTVTWTPDLSGAGNYYVYA